MDFSSTSYDRLFTGESFCHSLKERALWKLTGPDAERYLNGQVTNDIAKLAEGTVLYAAVCTAKGRMEGDVFVARYGDAYYLDAAPELRESLGARLEKFLIADDAVFEDISESWHLIHIFGEKAPTVSAPGFAVPNARYLLAGWDVWQPQSASILRIPEIPTEWVNMLRLELAIPTWGAELTNQTLPPEANLEERAISYHKGCYVGQETIARIKSIGHVNRTLSQFRVRGDQAPTIGAKIELDGKEVGVVTSAGTSIRDNSILALGYVPRAFAIAGKEFSTEGLALTVNAPFQI